jgi:hypothetical protein
VTGNALTTASSLMCPHGASVNIVSSNAHVSAGGAKVVRPDDTFIISGCPFQIPATPPIPSPCVKVVWVVPDVQASVGSPTLSQSSVGLCVSAAQVPQGPVTISTTQAQVQTR